MRHQGTVEIRTARLTLRRFVPRDAAAAFRNWTSDPRVTEFLRWPAHASEQITADVLADWIRRYDRPDFYQWAIVPQALQEPIGTISVVDQDERLSMLHVGYCIGSRWWGQGYVTEAFRAVIPYLFEQVGANRIESQHDPDNPASGRVMRKCGLTFEGTLRQADYSNRGIVDACRYAILAREYEQQKNSDLFQKRC